GEGGLESQSLDLLVQAQVVAAGLGAEGDAAVGPLGSADRALSRVAGAFLSPGLAAAAGDLGTGQSGLGALALVGEVGDNRLMHYVSIGFNAENGLGKFHRGDFLAGHIKYGNR